MNRLFFSALAAFGLLMAAAPAIGNDILIYKFVSTRPWAQYDCYRPESSSATTPPVPLAAVAGTYTLTEYWVVDQTASPPVLERVNYYSTVTKGVTAKYYSVSPPISLYADVDVTAVTPHVQLLQFIKASGITSENACIRLGSSTTDLTDITGDSVADEQINGEELNLTGVSKPYTVVTGLVLNHVASALAGSYTAVTRTTTSHAGEATYFRRLSFENGTATATLDAVSTKAVNTGSNIAALGGGTALTLAKGTLDYGVRVVELALEKLGYDGSFGPN